MLFRSDTTNILFICGGAFVGLEKIIGTRLDTKSIGFGAEIRDRSNNSADELLAEAMPEDFVKFGLIPELIGRVPVVVALSGLDEDALIRILKEPKNSLIRQYTKLFEMDGVRFTVEEDALRAIAAKTVERKTGARGLRAIMEEIVIDAMFTVPSDPSVTECIVTKEVVTEGAPVKLIRREGGKATSSKKSGAGRSKAEA